MLWIALAAAAPCDLSTLGPAIAGAENAFLRGDSKALRAYARDARREGRCDLTPTLAARLHRVAALETASMGDWDATVAHLRAGVAAHPVLPLDPALAADSRFGMAFQRAQEQPVIWTLGPGPGDVNGLRTSLRPDTVVLRGGSTQRALRFTALGAGVAAGGLYAGAWVARAPYAQAIADKDPRALDIRRTTNTLSIASLGAAALSTGLFTASFAF